MKKKNPFFKFCECCGNRFKPNSNRSKFCADCLVNVKRSRLLKSFKARNIDISRIRI